MNMPNDPNRPSTGTTQLDDTEKMTDRVSNMASEAKDRMSDVASQAKEKASEFSRSAVQKMDEKRMTAAEALHNTAESLRGGAQTGGTRMSSIANTAAEKLENTASYMREHDVRGMVGDLEGVVRRNPGPSLIAAAAVGFLLGAAIRGGGNREY